MKTEPQWTGDMPKKMSDPRRAGDWAELVAMAWLMELGYEVFRNISASGPIDIIAMKGAEFFAIDVKMMAIDEKARTYRNKATPRENQNGLSLKFVYVTHEGRCAFSRVVLLEEYKAALGRDRVLVNNPRAKAPAPPSTPYKIGKLSEHGLMRRPNS